ncbi:TetR/AcrR family transcriptional regulator [Rhizobium leguminosarum]|uniref:TetR/AcrR family transcriptional regulator n=1 Tax=Rhizobium leguminosarum TaxID=384 RepID=UPI0028F45860|nr:TetR/AcrR family transcriptional regulator [Rhizobium leguminosarum]
MKLQKQLRREQLLDVALSIVRERGADELTLGNLALRAGVSRPVAYEHFTTRAGLLIALYQRLEDSYVRTLKDGLAAAPPDLEAIAAVMSASYFNCLADLGSEALAISAALQGSGEMAKQQQRMMDEYVAIMSAALRPFIAPPGESLRILCVGLLGAAEAIARDVQASRTSQAAAVQALTSLIAKGVSTRRQR